MRKNIFTILLATIALSTIAQPTITSSSFDFNTKSTYFTSKDSINPNPIPTGNNVTWDFSKLKAKIEDSIVYSLKTSASNFSMFFPTANEIIAEYTHNNNHQIIERHNIKNQNEYLQLGSGYQNSGSFNKFKPAKKILKFPFVFNTTFTDTVRSTVKYDGYGTLKLPTGTFTNVYRTYTKDSISKSTIIYTYTWFNANRKLLTIYVDGVFKNVTFYGKPSNLTNIQTLSNFPNFNVYPNPSNGSFTLNTMAINGSIEILNILGEKIKLIDIKNNNTFFTLENKGIYIIKLISNGQLVTKKIIVE